MKGKGREWEQRERYDTNMIQVLILIVDIEHWMYIDSHGRERDLDRNVCFYLHMLHQLLKFVLK